MYRGRNAKSRAAKRNSTSTKTTKRGVVKKKTTSPAGTRLKQKTKPSGQQKIKGTVATKSTKYNVGRNKGVVKGKKSTM